MRDVLREIESIRRVSRLMLLAQRVSVLAAWAVGVALLLVLIDYLFRLPGQARLALDLAMIAGMVLAIWRWVWPAVRFRPTLTDLALRFERVLPGLRGHLASGVDFALGNEPAHSALAAQAVAEAQQRAGRENLRALVSRRRTRHDLGLLALAAGLVATLCITMPGSASIAVQRWLNPFGEARWLKRTGVESAMQITVHPRGRALPLQARVTRGLSDDMRIYAHYRLWRDGDAAPWQQVILTQQRGGLFERLIEPDADRIDLRFSSQDDETPVQTITLVPPPRIERADLFLAPPAYARRVVGNQTADLGPGTDERAVFTPPALAGTKARLTLSFNKPLPVNLQSEQWRSLLGWQMDDSTDGAEDDAVLSAEVNDQGRAAAWTIAWTLASTTRLAPIPVDEHGLAGADDVAYRIEAREDSPPTASIIDPAADRTCLPRAYVSLKAEARDDVFVDSLTLEAQVNDEPGARPVASLSGSGALEQLAETLDLSMLSVKPGDTVTIVAAAQDTFALDGRTHERAVSTPRRLRIITDAEFVEQVYQNLSAIRDSAIRIEQEQRDLMQRLERGQTRAGDLRDQSRIGQQVDRQREALGQIADRIRDNRLGDRELDELMAEAAERLDAAGQASNAASESLAQSQQQPAESDAEAARREQERAEAQRTVSEELADLIELLDRGQDSWVMRRQVEQLLTDQQNLEREARQTTDRMTGLDPSQLTEEQRRSLEELARRQEELARRGERLVDELRQRAEQMQRTDPDLARAMQEAAAEAQRRDLEQRMSDAAEQLQQNQGQRASDQQQQAMETLQNMLNQLESTERARAERLARQLESLLQSLEALIAGQETQLAALLAAQGQFAGLDRPMLQLNTNTYAVLDLAVEGGRDLAPVARLIEQAAGAQELAIAALRAASVDAQAVQTHEEQSLARLKEARDIAARLQEQLQQQEQQRRKRELVQAYRDLHERQAALRAETEPLAGVELDRRQRVLARQLGNQQAQIRNDAMDLLRRTEELAEAFVFEAGHRQIDSLAAVVVEDLRSATIGPAQLMRQQDIADRFLALALALADSPSEREFEDPSDPNSGGGGGGQGGGEPQPLVPPIAQLKLLRALQDAVYRSTRSLDETGSRIDEADRSMRIDELGRLQRELTDLAERLIQEMQRRGSGPPGAGGPGASPDGRPVPPPDTRPDARSGGNRP